MADIQHEALTYAEQHVVHRWAYADATARAAAVGFVASDIRKLAYQEDTDAYWVLTDHSPITWVQVTTGSVYTKTEVDALLAATAYVPTGSIQAYGGAAAPTGYVLCDGSAVSRTTYSDLFTAIGTGYGVGNGSTTFSVPDLQGSFPRGKDADALGDADGDEAKDLSHAHTTGDHSVTTAEAPIHKHNLYYQAKYVDTLHGGQLFNFALAETTGTTKTGTDNAGTGDAHNHGATGSEGSNAQDVMNPYLVVNYIIKT